MHFGEAYRCVSDSDQISSILDILKKTVREKLLSEGSGGAAIDGVRQSNRGKPGRGTQQTKIPKSVTKRALSS